MKYTFSVIAARPRSLLERWTLECVLTSKNKTHGANGSTSSREVGKAKGHYAKANPRRFKESKQKKGKSYTRDQMNMHFSFAAIYVKGKDGNTQSASGFPKLDMSCLAHFHFLIALVLAAKAAQS